MTLEQELKAIVGKENVFEVAEVLESYAQDNSFSSVKTPRCVVKPHSTEDVQKIVKLASANKTPLVPVSSGAPHFNGDTLPEVEGAVILDMSGMKKILRIDRRNRVAMIEPGVTFDELIPELKKEQLAPFMPLTPRNTKSVLTTWLERNPITMPKHHWDGQDPLLCLEVVYGNGDLFRTGSAAGPGSIEEQLEVGRAQVRPGGPSQVDYAKLAQGAQGTMGLVTWISMKCKVLPDEKRSFLVGSDDIVRLYDLARKSIYNRHDAQCLILNRLNLASLMKGTKEEITALSQELPSWILVIVLEGGGLFPEDRVAYQEKEFLEEAERFDLKPEESIAGVTAEDVENVLGKSSGQDYWKLRYKGGCQDIFFITTLKQTAGFVEKVKELAGAYQYSNEDIGVYIQPAFQGVNCHCEFNLNYDPGNVEETDKVKAFFKESSRAIADMGGFFSRPYGPWADIAYGAAPDSVDAIKRLKNIFDPDGILNPGKLCV
ncbi:FAD-binding oxidoreductase [Desulfobacula sp.]|uniref:FAD-binding oxidoreductase n=1 Tax=Desulfobacula sp. TaxID=2593537 RepID=UPI00260936FB|nr:FAD-binding oxidoreductase [Desulfobacula sp.]